MNPTGRFAPSPTGPLHLGNLRTALVAWLTARSQRGRFLLRFEDLDPRRSRRGYEADQIADLSALGIDWDGEPVHQSQRATLYDDALSRLRADGRVYPCFCTRAEVREAASAPHGKLPEGAYPGTCAQLSERESWRRVRTGERHALRLRAEGERIAWADRLLGERQGLVDDFVLMRSDGVYSYQLAVVVDDAAQGIGEVVRGADLADSTPRQVLLQRLLDLPTPSYAHVPLVLGPTGRRLAKRDDGALLTGGHGRPAETLSWLAHSIGLAHNCEAVDTATALLTEFALDLVPRHSVKLC